jgi:hypothetical protein
MATYGTTALWALRKLTGGSLVSDVDAGFDALAEDVAPLLTPYSAGLLSARPVSTVGTPGIAGRSFFATDTQVLYRDIGTGWLPVGGSQTLIERTSTSSTFALSDSYSIITLTNASAITVTVPANATVAFPVGTVIDLIQGGAGQVTIAAAGGVTVRSFQSRVNLAGQYAAGSLVKKDTNTWDLVGNLA